MYIRARTAPVTAATAALSQSWSQSSSFVTIRRRPNDRFPSPNGDLRICLDLHLRIWKAGTVTQLLHGTCARSRKLQQQTATERFRTRLFAAGQTRTALNEARSTTLQAGGLHSGQANRTTTCRVPNSCPTCRATAVTAAPSVPQHDGVVGQQAEQRQTTAWSGQLSLALPWWRARQLA